MGENNGSTNGATPGGPGGIVGSLQNGSSPRETLKLVEQALSKRWDISEATKKRLAGTIVAIVLDPNSSARTRISAMRVIAQLESQNLDAEMKAVDKVAADLIDVQYNSGREIREAYDEAASDPEYVALQRKRARDDGAEPGASRQNGKPRRLEDGGPPCFD
jgi:hypothetical protein